MNEKTTEYETNFDWSTLDQSILTDGLFVGQSPLSAPTLTDIFEYYSMLKNKDLLRQAQISKGIFEQKKISIRSDFIFWIEDWDVTPGLKNYKIFLDQLMDFFIQHFRLPLKRFESQIACYPPGSFYKKHYDQHEKAMHRQVSIILYLTNYQQGDGGQLMLYPKGRRPIEVRPRCGRIVIYPSRGMLHEVLPTNLERVSITSWMRDDLIYF